MLRLGPAKQLPKTIARSLQSPACPAMSTAGNMEPVTKGKVVIHTSLGPIDIELWPKEAPKAVRNFVQLCLEGYYNNTIFHRIVKDFIIQGGDPTGTGQGGESVYGRPFEDEYHSRLKFSHRGIVACASFEKNKNGSQFFITLDKTPELEKRNTIFGKVMGDTIYNLPKFSELELEGERPLYPPKIFSTEVVWNPFDDIIPRVFDAPKPQQDTATLATNKQVAKTKAVKNKSLLSFGGDEEEGLDEDEPLPKPKMVSIAAAMPQKKKKEPKLPVEEQKLKPKDPDSDNEDSLPPLRPASPLLRQRSPPRRSRSRSRSRSPARNRRSRSPSRRDSREQSEDQADDGYESPEKEKPAKISLGSKKPKKTESELWDQLRNPEKALTAKEREKLTSISLVEENRIKYSTKLSKKDREMAALAKLAKFQHKLKSTDSDLQSTRSGGDGASGDWKTHRLVFEKVAAENPDDTLAYYDPLKDKKRERDGSEDRYAMNEHERRLKMAKRDDRW